MGTLITHKEAARMLQTVSEKRLREKDADDKWAFEPDALPRLQEKPGAKIWLLRETVEAFIARRDEALRAAVKPPMRPIQVSAAEIEQAQARGHRGHARALRLLAQTVS